MKIILKHMDFFAYHGVYDEERENGNTFRVNITLELPDTKGCQTDQLKDTVNYQQLYDVVKKEIEQPSALLEHVTCRIKTALQKEFPQLTALSVQVGKHQPPLGGQVKWAYVEL